MFKKIPKSIQYAFSDALCSKPFYIGQIIKYNDDWYSIYEIDGENNEVTLSKDCFIPPFFVDSVSNEVPLAESSCNGQMDKIKVKLRPNTKINYKWTFLE